MLTVQISPQQCRDALRQCETPATKVVVDNSDLLAMFTGIVNGTLAALEGNSSAALGLVDKWATVTDVAGKSSGITGLRLASSSVQLVTQTLSLVKLGSAASPGRVVATVGAVFTKKVALMFGMAADEKQAKLVAAAADLVSSTLVVGIGVAEVSAAAAGATTVPWILLVGAIAQLGASAYSSYTAFAGDS
jgi:hypothetical protein